MATAPLKRILVGRPLASHKAEHQLLPKFLALPVFSSDALSSNAYATEEMMLVLVTAGAGALAFRIPIAIAIATVLVIVVVSYRQTVRAYPGGGGSYIVAHDNLGTLPGLIAAAALLADYVLTVAVSVVAGFLAITSAVPSLARHRVVLSIGLVVLLTLVNLRGVKEAGSLFAVPTYGFVAMVYLMLGLGFAQCLSGCPQAATANLPLEATAPLSLFLVLKAFSSGATALTGVEAISNGVPAFRRPQAKNAATTLAMMAVMTVTMFLGITVLTVLLARPGESRDRGIPLGVVPDRRDGVRPNVPLLRAAGAHGRDPDPRGQHVLPRLPAALLDPGARSIHAVAVPQPRRPARVLERDHHPVGGGEPARLRVRRGSHPPDPALRRGCLHRVHPVPDRDGATLVPSQRPGVATEHDRQRDRCDGHRCRPRHRDHHEVQRRRMDRARGDAGDHRVLHRRASPLRMGRTSAARRDASPDAGRGEHVRPARA